MMRYAVLVAAALTACSPHGYISTIQVPAEQAAQLTIIRLPLLEGSGQTWVISVDEHQVVGLRAGEHATVTVPAGDRIITSDCVTAFPLFRPGSPLRVPVRAGAQHDVTLGSCMLAEVTEATATGLIAQTKPVPGRRSPPPLRQSDRTPHKLLQQLGQDRHRDRNESVTPPRRAPSPRRMRTIRAPQTMFGINARVGWSAT